MLEGDPVLSVIMLDFSSMAAARSWYSTPEYQVALKHRLAAADYRADSDRARFLAIGRGVALTCRELNGRHHDLPARVTRLALFLSFCRFGERKDMCDRRMHLAGVDQCGNFA